MAFPSATVSANVEDPANLDHWEGDLITGSQSTHISHFGGPSVALHPVRENTGERHYQCGTSIEHADMTIDGGIALATIWDRGMKLAQHKGLTVDTTVRVYSCDPQSRWQRCTMNIRTTCCVSIPERHKPVTRCPSRPEHDRMTLDSTSTEDIGVSDAGGCTGDSCCKHRLNLRPDFYRRKGGHITCAVHRQRMDHRHLPRPLSNRSAPLGHVASYTCGD